MIFGMRSQPTLEREMYLGEARIFLEGVIHQSRTGTVDWASASREGYEALRELRGRAFIRRPDKTGSLSEEPLTPSYNVINAIPFLEALLSCVRRKDVGGV